MAFVEEIGGGSGTQSLAQVRTELFSGNDYEKLPGAIGGENDAGSGISNARLGRSMGDFVVSAAEDVSCHDPVTGIETLHAGSRIHFSNGSRIVFRLLALGTEGATSRLYLERYDRENIDSDAGQVLKPLAEVAKRVAGVAGTIRPANNRPSVHNVLWRGPAPRYILS